MFIFFVFVSSQTGISAHPRYVLPVIPMIFIFSSKIFSQKNYKIDESGFSKNVRQFRITQVSRIIPTTFVVWAIISSLLLYPHSLSYFNEIIGCHVNAPKYLLGSCVDWGQDEYELRDWVRKHPEAKPLYVSCSSSIPLNVLGIQSDGFVPEEPQEGYMILNVNLLYGRDGKYQKYRKLKPIIRLGKSLVVFVPHCQH
jgi:hypothetical protein